MPNRLICICNLVDEREIMLYLQKGAISVADIQRLTRAGTSCGKCLPALDEIVKHHENKKPKDQQTKLDFGF